MTTAYGALKVQKLDLQGNSNANQPNENDWRFVVDNEQLKIKYYNDSTSSYSTIQTMNTSGKLTVAGNLEVADDVVIDGGTLSVDSTNNRVGINTNSPLQKLHVSSGNGLFSGTTTTKAGIEIIPLTDATEGGGRIFLRENNSENYGFSVGFNGGPVNAILNWPQNYFCISRHDNSSDGAIVMKISRTSGNIIVPNSQMDLTCTDYETLQVYRSTYDQDTGVLRAENGYTALQTTFAYSYNNYSDSRIKQNITDTNIDNIYNNFKNIQYL